ncbi:MAG: M42 family peptidase, partial [Clostridia bacterium]|nr:M42 family peptidase [Clostridia bacterium]
MNRKTEGIDLLRALCLEFGPSGCEDRVADLIKENIEGSYDELIEDRMGGVVALIRGNGKTDKKLMLNAHMDEVG